jgi:hypothetical protein
MGGEVPTRLGTEPPTSIYAAKPTGSLAYFIDPGNDAENALGFKL